MALTEVSRDVAVPPVSAALLLTSPDALEWWPGLRLDHGGDTSLAMSATLTRGRTAERIDIEALPPRRTPTAFVAEFRIRGGSYGPTDGAMTLAYRATGTRATLHLEGPRDDLTVPARRFLDRFARVAEGRSAAA